MKGAAAATSGGAADWSRAAAALPPLPLFEAPASAAAAAAVGSEPAGDATEASEQSLGSHRAVIDRALRPTTLTCVEECDAYLRTFPGGEALLAETRRKVGDFTRSYVIVAGYHKHASGKVAALVAGCRDGLQHRWLLHCAEAAIEPAWARAAFPRRQVGLAAESVVMADLHTRVLASMGGWTARQDVELVGVMRALGSGSSGGSGGAGRHLSAHALRICGVPERIQGVDLTPAATTICKLGTECRCPLEMMTCLLEADNAIIDAISRALGSLAVQVSADELLPLFIAALAVACLPNLSAVLHYMMTFHGEGDLQGQSGYQLAMLEAAVEFFSQCHRRGLVRLGADSRAPREWAQATPREGGAVDLLPAALEQQGQQEEEGGDALAAPNHRRCSSLASKLMSGIATQGDSDAAGSLTHYFQASEPGGVELPPTGRRKHEAAVAQGLTSTAAPSASPSRPESYSLTEWQRAFQVSSREADTGQPAAAEGAVPQVASSITAAQSGHGGEARGQERDATVVASRHSAGYTAATFVPHRAPAVIPATDTDASASRGGGLGSFLENLRLNGSRASFSSTR
eukprot:jgi/Tetstr1/454758/TSEL_041642.t1